MSADAPRQFVDTNVLICAYDSSAGVKHEIARQLTAGLWNEQSGCLSIQVLQEFYVVATRKLAKAEPHEVATRVRDLAMWHVFSPTKADVLAAIDLHLRHQLSFWDAMIVHSAQALGCATLWSEDLNHEQLFGGVTVRNPFVETAAHQGN